MTNRVLHEKEAFELKRQWSLILFRPLAIENASNKRVSA